MGSGGVKIILTKKNLESSNFIMFLNVAMIMIVVCSHSNEVEQLDEPPQFNVASRKKATFPGSVVNRQLPSP